MSCRTEILSQRITTYHESPRRAAKQLLYVFVFCVPCLIDLPLEWFDYLSAPPLPVKSSAVSSTTTKSGTDTGRALRVTSDGNSFTADWDTPTLSQKSSDGDAIDCEECLYLVYYAKLPPGLVGAALSAIKLNTVLNTLRYGTAAGDWTAEKTLTVSVEDKGDYVVNVLAKVDPSGRASLQFSLSVCLFVFSFWDTCTLPRAWLAALSEINLNSDCIEH